MKQLHPFVSAVYYLFIILSAVIINHPICIAISVIGAVLSAFEYKGRQKTLKSIFLLTPIIIITAIINPLFSHEGITIIGYFYNGNPITSESIWYGVGMACALASVMLWFISVNVIITTEKIMFLLGRIAPSMALVLSLVLRIVPRFSQHIRQVYLIKKSTNGPDKSGYPDRLREALAALSASVTWILDDSVHTAESMKCRGYGLPDRTTYSRYVFRKYDALCLSFIIVLSAYVIYGAINGSVYWQYYPCITGEINEADSISVFIAYLVLCLSPVCIKNGV